MDPDVALKITVWFAFLAMLLKGCFVSDHINDLAFRGIKAHNPKLYLLF